MKSLLPFIALVGASACFADEAVTFETIVRYHKVVSGHSIKVAIHQRPYDFSKHKVTGGVENEGPAKVDGVPIAGTDGGSPEGREDWPILKAIVSFELEWDGQKIPVPSKIYLNLLSLTLERDSIQFVPRPSGKELLIQATGGDGGGSYLISIVLRKDGEHIQYPYIYWEEVDLPKYPFIITQYLTGKGQEDSVVEEIPWLKPNTEPDGTDQPAPVPKSKPTEDSTPDPESKPRPQ